MTADVTVFVANLAAGPFYCRMDMPDEVEPAVRRYQLASRAAMHELRMLILALAVDETGRQFETIADVRAWLNAHTADDVAMAYQCAMGAVGISGSCAADLEQAPLAEAEAETSHGTTNVVPLNDRHRHR